MNKLLLISFAMVSVLGCSTDSVKQATGFAKVSVNPSNWPKSTSPLVRDSGSEQRIAAMLSAMTLHEKVGQVIQADIRFVTPEQVKTYNLGAILNGGNSAPHGNNRGPAVEWLKLADAYYLASTDKTDGGLGIPVLWGTDAVHGNNKVMGATIFPHNIGLGAANDPELIERIGAITAKEVLVTGLNWTFAPTVAVARNDRWGRTYESYSEDPAIVASYAGPMIRGVQGAVGSAQFLGPHHLLANVKHFVGDGGTEDGIDQGNSLSTEAQMIRIHAAGYPPAIEQGAMVVMASFNAWHGQRMHGYKELLTDVLVGQMGFDGFVVGDWNGHGKVAGCSNTDCAVAFNAGLDMFMAPDSWQELHGNMMKSVVSGEISMARLDEAVSRILRVKLRAGLFEAGLPSTRPLAGQFNLLGANEHRQVAREAVRKSLVLLKNNNQLLPLAAKAKVLIAGHAADHIGQQSGGWTLNWQGTDNKNTDFPNGSSIYAGIKQAVTAAGGSVQLSPDGSYSETPDVAIVVFGEQPYAEFKGDVADLDFVPTDSLALLTRYKNAGIPTVSVFLSGRPMWVNPELNQSDAFVAAWLPGTEGAGVADLLFSRTGTKEQYDFTGRLSFSWPADPTDAELNKGDKDYQPLFAYGYGLSLNDNVYVGALSEKDASRSNTAVTLLSAGQPLSPWQMELLDEQGLIKISDGKGQSQTGAIKAETVDSVSQDDTLSILWTDKASWVLSAETLPQPAFAENSNLIELVLNVLSKPTGPVYLTVSCGLHCEKQLDITERLALLHDKGWQQLSVPLSCFTSLPSTMVTSSVKAAAVTITATTSQRIQLKELKLVNTASIRCDNQ